MKLSISPPSRRVAVVLAVVLLGSVLAGGIAIAKSRDSVPAGVAFKVSGESVSTDAVREREKALQALYGIARPTTPTKAAAFRRDTAKSMAVEILMKSEARKRGIVIADKAVSDSLAALIEQRYPDGGHDAFVKALGQQGASEEQVRAEIAEQMMVARLFDEVTKDVSVSDDEVRSAFEKRRAELGSPETRTLRNIVVRTRSDASRVLAALRAGAPFASVARRSSLDAATRSKGGLLGTVSASDLETGYARSAFAAAVGQPFGPVKTTYGWNIGLVVQVQPAQAATYANAAATLKATLRQEKSMAAWTAWLRKLLVRADVRYADDYRPAHPDAVPPMGAGATTG